MSALIHDAKRIQTKSRTHEVKQTSDRGFEVTSGASGNVYHVWLGPDNVAHCSCNWGQYRKTGAGSACSHVIACHEYLAEQNGRRVSAWASEEDARRQKRTMVDIGDGVTLTTRKAATA